MEHRLRLFHRISGITITAFVALHLFNHAMALVGAERHIATMAFLRQFYRHPVAETLLLVAVLNQVFTGIRLHRKSGTGKRMGWQALQHWSGLYLAFFFVIHLGAVLVGRTVLHLDTNFYFGVAGLNTFPFALFFVPYYALAVISFFAHIASIHARKMERTVWGLTPNTQAQGLLCSGIVFTVILLHGLTNGFMGVAIPAEYGALIGR
ncbi:MAG TPA: hypothetical protein PLR96_11370 [Flavobacteriales bacterium]|nr:hypothetical protein [Flavobacteriales bacterium]